MEVPKTIGKYQINCLISTILERRLFVANDPEGKTVILKESINNDDLIHEYDILAKINHKNIIKPIELIEYNNKNYLVLPRAETDLSKFMNSSEISGEMIKLIMNDLFSAVQCLNILGIWHRNICPENILVFNDGQNKKRIVLADFKLAINFTGVKNDEYRASNHYMAPELLLNKGYTNKIDCWSCGVIMYQLYKHCYPFSERATLETKSINMTDIPLDASDLISHLLCDQDMRYSASEALKHPYFKNLY